MRNVVGVDGMRHPHQGRRAVLVYAAGASLWIVGSDWLLVATRAGHGAWREIASTLKGWVFVAVTASLLGWVFERARGTAEVDRTRPSDVPTPPQRLLLYALAAASVLVLTLAGPGRCVEPP